MTDKVDMSLDELVKLNKTGRGGATRGGRGMRAGRGGALRGLRGGRRSLGAGLGGIRKRRSGGPGMNKNSPFKSVSKLADGKWAHDLFPGGRRASSGLTSGPTKIIISNLDYGVNDKDIKDLFQDFGAIRKAAVHYDRSGRSLGTADVLFEKRQDAVKAINKYNGVQLDGRPMDIQLATNGASPRAGVAQAVAAAGASPSMRGRGGPRRGGFRGGRGAGRGGRGGNRQNKPAKTQAELDAELDTYAKMQTD